jgi:hypothetical protein
MSDDADGGGFDRGAWHDDTLRGLAFRVGDADHDDWTAELELDLDHIVGWLADGDGYRFRMARATLTFHDVTDLEVALGPDTAGHQVALSLPSIDRIDRRRVADQKICLDRPYYIFTVHFHSHPSGRLSFGASGFSQLLNAAPVDRNQPRLFRPRGR